MPPTPDCVALVVAGATSVAEVSAALRPLGCIVVAETAGFGPTSGTSRPDVILVEDDRPGRDGFAILRRLRDRPEVADVPALILCSGGGEPAELRRKAVACGAADVLVAPTDDAAALQMRVLPHLKLARLRGETLREVRRMKTAAEAALAETASREREIIHRLMLAAEFRDGQAGDHLARVAGFIIAIAEGLGLSEADANDLALASTMHDVGKIGVSDTILLKAGPLTSGERDEMMKHAVRGYRMLQGSSSRLLKLAAEIALTHHERWDGGGYPQGLAGDRIPLSGRITAVADVFDALIAERPYKQSWSLDRARAFVEEQSGSHFDPDCVAAFLSRWEDVVALVADRRTDTQAA